MPRIPHHLLLCAQKVSPLLPLVLRATRTLPSAINELRWLVEHVEESSPKAPPYQQKRQLLRLCERRERGEPLQYILGSQPFGELDIKCRKGVLIPRPETEAYTTHLAKLLLKRKLHPELASSKYLAGFKERPSRFRILDLCSGSGCISLLLFSLLRQKFPRLRILGYDISPNAVNLANENLIKNFGPGSGRHEPQLKGLQRKIKFKRYDIFEDSERLMKDLDEEPTLSDLNKAYKKLGETEREAVVDIIISNPPYISPHAFATSTSRSVRLFEPKLALVPPIRDSDEPSPRQLPESLNEFFFYKRLMELHTELGSKVLLMEVSNSAQAYNVAWLAVHKFDGNRIEIWRDHPDQGGSYTRVETIKGRHIPVKGSGLARAVVLFKEESEKAGVSVDADGVLKFENGEASEE